MDTGDARKVIQIIAIADGGCQFCVEELVNKFLSEYPGFYRYEVYDWIEEVDIVLAGLLKREHAV